MRQRQKIKAAAGSVGASVTSMVWEPIRSGSEKEGLAGGWTVWGIRLDGTEVHALGLNADETVEWIRKYWKSPKG